MDAIDKTKFEWKQKRKQHHVSECYFIAPSGKRIFAGTVHTIEAPEGRMWQMYKAEGLPVGRCDTPHEAQTKLEAMFLRIYNRQYHGTAA